MIFRFGFFKGSTICFYYLYGYICQLQPGNYQKKFTSDNKLTNRQSDNSVFKSIMTQIMKKISLFSSLIILKSIILSFGITEETKKKAVYKVVKLNQPIQIDANWDKPQWSKVKPLNIDNYLGTMPKFRPSVQAKVMYNEENLFVIFRVHDRYVRCITDTINGPVWEDSCVEFFFSPDTNLPERYFNLEVNCGGTPLFYYQIIPRKERVTIEPEDIKSIEIAHSLPKIVDPEITGPVTWTIEYRIPLKMLKKYSNLTTPAKGVVWKANFYKIARITSNPHSITWSVIENNILDFHAPAFFGKLVFK